MLHTLLGFSIAWAGPIASTQDAELQGPPSSFIDPIINGSSATIDDYPMTGGLLMSGVISLGGYTGSVDTFVCSSTLIAPDTVLLAAHCLDDAALTMGIGEINDKELYWSRQADLTSWDGTSQNPPLPSDAIDVVGTVSHEAFDIEAFDIGIAENSDIALVFLAEPILDVDFAYLPTAEEADQIVEDAVVDVVGWGQQVATSSPFEAPPAGTYAIKQWGESVLAEVGTHEFQVGAQSSDVRKCHGDSGGPTFLQVETVSPEATRIIGVTSHSYDDTDCSSKGGVDTRVDAHLAWIDDNMRAACQDGTRTWCEEAGIPALPRPVEGDTSDGIADGETAPAKSKGCNSAPGALWLLLPGLAAVGPRRRS